MFIRMFTLAACLLSSAPAWAAATLHALVESAWQRSPQVRALLARQEEGAAMQEVAGSWLAAGPTLGLSDRSDRWNGKQGQRESEVSLSAPIQLPGQRASGQRLAASVSQELAAQLAQAQLAVAGEVRQRYWEAVAAQAALEERQLVLAGLQQLAADVQRRVQAGDMARSDGLLAQQEVLAASAELAQARSRAAEAMARLRILTGASALPQLDPEAIPDPAGASAPTPQAAPAGEARAALADGAAATAQAGGSGEASAAPLRAALAGAARARAALEATSAGAWPGPTVALALRRERERDFAPSASSVGLSLQIPLGGKFRNRPAETQARSQLAAAEAELAQQRDTLGEEQELARTTLANARLALDAAEARAAALREHHALIEKAFRLGERPLAELLRAQALRHEAELSARKQGIALAQAHAQLNQSLGILP